jgi:RimJ/RimL family protein N-acetyltransferase
MPQLRPLPSPEAPLPIADGAELRPWRLRDAAALVAAWRDPDIARWTAVPSVVTLAAARSWIDGDAARRAGGVALDLVIGLEPGSLPVGEIGLSHVDDDRRAALVGYWVSPRHRGLGLAAAALRAFHTFVVTEAGIDTLLARCHPENEASIATARRAGFVPLGEDEHGWMVLRSAPGGHGSPR